LVAARRLDTSGVPRYTGRVTVEEFRRLEQELRQLEPPDDAAWSLILEHVRKWKWATVTDVALTRDLFTELIMAAGREDDDSPFELELSFERVMFRDQLAFNIVRFRRLFVNQCWFAEGVTSKATFENTTFRHVTFGGQASFADATFIGHTNFTGVRFGGGASFDTAQFRGYTWFLGVSFRSSLSFWDAAFAASVRFDGLASTDRVPSDPDGDDHAVVDFSRATFEDSAVFDVRTKDAAVFSDVTFRRRVSMYVAAETIAFDRAHFSDDAGVGVRAEKISFTETRLEHPFVIRCSGEVVADGAVFAADGSIVGPRAGIPDEPGRLRSLRGATVSKLTLSRLDLSGCLFENTHGLDELRIESSCTFARSPPGWRFMARRTIAEENLWRGGQWRVPPFDGWFLDHTYPAEVLDPAEIAPLYRSLRKATESRKDEPGAADFYYGEMEMRRHAARRLGGERLLLTIFWAVSGYALRAMRALVALTVICIAFAFAFRVNGFVEPHAFGDMLIYSFGASARVRTGFENDPLTSAGEVLHIMLGIIGPILYGLALLSVRGRVKR
jgi:uncharacterized protein YjbI with pentapeptide repeats